MDPIETMATMPTNRKLVIDRPGFINYASQKDGGKYAGCLLRQFNGWMEVNDFFRKNENLLVIELWRDQPGDIWHVLYTNTLEGDTLEDFLAVQEEVAMAMSKRKQAREAEAKEAAEAEEKELKERERLVTVGKKCEANHGKKMKGKGE